MQGAHSAWAMLEHVGDGDTIGTVGRELSRPPLAFNFPRLSKRRRKSSANRVAGLFSRLTSPCIWLVTGLAQGLGSFHSWAPRRPVMADLCADRPRKGERRATRTFRRDQSPAVCDGRAGFPFPGSSGLHLPPPPPAWSLRGARREWWTDER